MNSRALWEDSSLSVIHVICDDESVKDSKHVVSERGERRGLSCVCECVVCEC